MKKIQKWKLQFVTVALSQAISILGNYSVQLALI